MSLRKIKIYGNLRKLLGESIFEADISSPADAFKFLLANFPHLESHFYQNLYRIKMGNTEISENLLHMEGKDDISIIPVVTGAGPVFAVLGAVGSGAAAAATAVVTTAVGVATAVGGAIVAGATALAAVPVLGSIATTVATTLAIDGVMSLLTPSQPVGVFDTAGAETNANMAASNFAFNGIANISRSGLAVPVVYGERFVGSIIVSNGVDTVQVEGTA
tara:strand:+ start:37 stop:693 length:657 start_codon:yes stop_codon:yes gene_type:complete